MVAAVVAMAGFLVWQSDLVQKPPRDSSTHRERILSAQSGDKMTFAPDPSRKIEWVDVITSGIGVGDGPGKNWTTTYDHGGTVGFIDGSTANFPVITVSGQGDHGVVTISTSVK